MEKDVEIEVLFEYVVVALSQLSSYSTIPFSEFRFHGIYDNPVKSRNEFRFISFTFTLGIFSP